MKTSFLNFRPKLDYCVLKAFSWHCKQGRIKMGGATGAIARTPRCTRAPRDELYLFQIKYSFEKLRDSEATQEYDSILYSYVG